MLIFQPVKNINVSEKYYNWGNCSFFWSFLAIELLNLNVLIGTKTGFASFAKKSISKAFTGLNQVATHKRKNSVNALSEYAHKCVSV